MFEDGFLRKASEAAKRMRDAELYMCQTLDAYNHAREDVEHEKSRLILSREIAGRNEHERDAQLTAALKRQKERVLAAHKAYMVAKAEWRYAEKVAEIWLLAGYVARKERDD